MNRWGGAAAIALLLGACTMARRPEPTVPASTSAPRPPAANAAVGPTSGMPESTPSAVKDRAAAVASDAARSDHESDAKVREGLAADASRNADACLALAPQAAACLYYHGVALGLEARAHPLHAMESLKSMLAALDSAEAADAAYDNAGPTRVRALVLVRAPGWPLGPGDPDAGLAAARRAVSLSPQYPPNVLALAEALAKTGDTQGSRDSYAQARDLAQGMPPSADRDDWLREADKALQRN